MFNFISDVVALAMTIFIIYLVRYIFKDYDAQEQNVKPKKNIIGKDIDLHGHSLH